LDNTVVFNIGAGGAGGTAIVGPNAADGLSVAVYAPSDSDAGGAEGDAKGE
jgi:hypothetical protein